jgi:hypothetical protein
MSKTKFMHTDPETQQSIYFHPKDEHPGFSQIKLSCDLKKASIVIDITSTVKENIIVTTKNADDRIVSAFSWYVLDGRNVSSVKNLSPGEYTVQLLSIYGDMVAAYTVSLSDS